MVTIQHSLYVSISKVALRCLKLCSSMITWAKLGRGGGGDLLLSFCMLYYAVDYFLKIKTVPYCV